MNERNAEKQRDSGRGIDAVIEQYAASSPGPSREMLARWVERYPQYAEELTEFTISWTVTSPMSPPSIEETQQTRRATARHKIIVQEALDRQRAVRGEQSVASSFRGVVAEAQARGLSRKEVASALDLSAALVDKLDRRLVRYQTIPAVVVGAISRLLSAGTDQVSRYLQGPPLLPRIASYRAEQAPAVAGTQDFAEAVASDRTIRPERRQELLALTRIGDQERTED